MISIIVVSSNISWKLRKILGTRELLQEIGGWDPVMYNGKFSIKRLTLFYMVVCRKFNGGGLYAITRLVQK